mgnify:CR=1 FL=1
MEVGKKTFVVKALILRVVDGDTMEVRVDALFGIQKLETIRLMGIDTPEIHSRSAPERIKAHEAKDWLKERVEGKQVWLRTWKEKEKFGRYLADIFFEDPAESEIPLESVNNEMIELGLGKPYFGGKKE